MKIQSAASLLQLISQEIFLSLDLEVSLINISYQSVINVEIGIQSWDSVLTRMTENNGTIIQN